MGLGIYRQYYNQFDEFLTDGIVRYVPYAKDHLNLTISTIITKLFVVTLAGLLAYEAIFHTGIYFNWWQDPAKEFFIDKPVHCAHVYAQVNFVEVDNEQVKDSLTYDRLTKASQLLLKKPLKYHIEFGPDDYDYKKDPELGSTVGFLINKLNGLAAKSTIISQSSYQPVGDGLLFYKKSLKNDYKKDALCLQQIETGKTVSFFVAVVKN